MSQFAAGCAVCGADLEAARRAQANRRQLPRPRLPGLPQDLVVLFVLSLTTLAFPILGILITVLVLRREKASDQRPLRVTLYVVVAVGIVLLGNPATRYAGIQAYLYF